MHGPVYARLDSRPVSVRTVSHGGGAVALSMEEQRILEEIERKLCAEDPRLASRFDAFGVARAGGWRRAQRARTISGILAFVLIAAVPVMMFVLSPYSGSHH